MNDRYERGLARKAELGGPGPARAAVYDALAGRVTSSTRARSSASAAWRASDRRVGEALHISLR
ncbi:hypothetical protein ACFYUV_49905 [Nonomuraea sp. NPDC003560]|uniref:hypothetical protein n=1 Tax=Nonomuraea sp. NPDC003560 TaxID=3364341 RepID=UPI0036BDC006